MITAFPNQFTAMVIEVARQPAPLHTDRYSSSKPLSFIPIEFERLSQNRAEAC
jgi:hypothetical protein